MNSTSCSRVVASPGNDNSHGRASSASSATDANTLANSVSDVTTVPTENFASPPATESTRSSFDMATYYRYGADGSVMRYAMQPIQAPPMFVPPYMTHPNEYTPAPYVGYSYTSGSWGHSDADSSAVYPCYEEYGEGGEGGAYYDDGVDHGYDAGHEYRESGHSGYCTSDYSGSTQVDDQPCPPLDEVRKYRDLHSLLPWIDPQRLHNGLFGRKVNIIEEGTSTVFAYQVPKKMLVLFCSRPAIAKFLRTVEREDNENWRGGPVTQELRLPRGLANHVGIKIMLAWMMRACKWECMGSMRPICVPQNLFAAISLARTFMAFGLHRDASRVDNTIAGEHLKRPLYPDEMKSIWLCLPKDSRYTYRMVEKLAEQISAYESGVEKELPAADEVFRFLGEHPALRARVRDREINQEFQPSFGTEWCKKLATQPDDIERENPTKSAARKFGVLRIVAPGSKNSEVKGDTDPPETISDSARS
ncbi:hypothetical protein BU26DRAFT_554988 [Trematosphaeria pertusa]|uniref:Uncharacterized protein n=1 Tax=Trematosphaeria pertusa TaxID=390896 RepID=A0A6A6I0I6_9PLEO|nr:uncharacterized protein BU26DRAFT_554988 [Trematosphaeria pertusa]KAF2243518.1 hypothetical protein BU26DRAFT_554988 [Trematosphaeria pertusa]